MVVGRSRRLAPRLVLWCLPIALASCKPDLEGRPSLIDSARVIAIRSTMAEVKPGTDVTYDALVAKPIDDTSSPALNWALCLEQKPLANTGPIADACLVPSGPSITDLGAAVSVVATIPAGACQLFGPLTPTPAPGEPALRAVDPDTTGGYYQPVRLLARYEGAASEYEVGVTRLLCGLSNVSQEQSATFTKDYRANQNPSIEQVTLQREDGTPIPVDFSGASVASVGRSERVIFDVSWPLCPTVANCGDGVCTAGEDAQSCSSDCQDPQGCAGAEVYLNYDIATQSLVERRESIRVSWYATDGDFEHDRTGRAESESEQPDSPNGWTAPQSPGLVRFWLVIRDDRRGVSWASFDLNVE